MYQIDKYIENEIDRQGDKGRLKRISEDSYINTFGRSLIDLCIEFNFIILNGLCIADKKGAFTFKSPNGNSVNAYFIISDKFMSLFGKFDMHVHSNVESWHMPISMSISFDINRNVIPYESVSCFDKIIWNENKLPAFMSEITSEVFRGTIFDLMFDLKNNVSEAVHKFIRVIC